MTWARAATCVLALAIAGCAHAEAAERADGGGAAHVGVGWHESGLATWYGGKLAGHKTASGERFDPSALTAAHRTLPIGTWVEVVRVDTGARVRVRINDRGPFGKHDRVIDLSHAAAKRIDMLRAGVVRVELRVVEGP